ncbi:MAG: dTDP-4-dehydrorhamnose reductase [Panacagrimonas sp.]
MRILLTGGSGQVGTEFRRRAAGLDLLAPPRSELDLAQPDTLPHWLAQHRPDLILSVGAFTAVDRAEDEPALAHRVNAEAVDRLGAYAAKHAAPLLHVSTDYVFDGHQPDPYRESDRTGPTGVYGSSKLAGELAARGAPAHLILRTSWVFAAHGNNFVKTMLRLGRERDRLRVVDDQFGGPTWAGDIAQALRSLVDRIAGGEALPWGTYHYGGQPHLSWCGFAQAVIRGGIERGLIEREPVVEAIRTHEFPTRARRPANSRLDGSLTARKLGLTTPDWGSGLSLTLDELARPLR